MEANERYKSESSSSLSHEENGQKVVNDEKRLNDGCEQYKAISIDAKAEPADEEKVQVDPVPSDKELPAWHPKNNPDGGMKAWTVVIGGSCGLFVSFGWISSMGVFQAYYETHQLRNYSPSEVAWIPSLEAFMMFAGGPIVGKVYDNYGVQPLLVIGSFLHVFGLMMASLCKEYYQFILAQGICSPLGASMIFYPSMSVVSTWFFKRRALAFGFVAAGSSLGGIIFPIMVQRMLPQVGFGWAMRTAAFLILFLLIIANLTVTSRIAPIKSPFAFIDFVKPFREITFALTIFGFVCFFFGMFLPFTFLIVQAQAAGMSTYLASYLVAILNATSFFGRILPGWAADKFGRFNVIIVMCTFTTILDFAIWIPADSNAPIIVFAALYGFGSGAFVSMQPAIIAQISPDISKIGIRTGTLFASISVAALVGSPIGGAILSNWDGDFTGLQVFCGAMQASGTLVLIAARFAAGGRKLRIKV